MALERRKSSAAFTLIELLLVIAVVAVLTTAVGIGLTGGTDNAALGSARGILATQLTAVRSQAALHGTSAALLVAAEVADADRYLRFLAVGASNDAGGWTVNHDGTALPRGVWIDPAAITGPAWVGPVAVDLEGSGQTTSCWALVLNTQGGVPGGATIRLVLAQLGEDGPVFSATNRQVELSISRYGAISVQELEEPAP